MKVLIADKLSPKAVSALEAMGLKVEVDASLEADTLPARLGDAEVLVVRSTKVTAAAIEAGENLSLIIRAGAGVNTIDLKAANHRGIHVANCPGQNTAAVAELALGHIIAADRRIPDATADLRAGLWKKKEYGKARGLKGRTLGILGMGSIGQALAGMARGLDMEVIGWSRSLTTEKAKKMGIGYCATPEAVAENADVVSVHLAAAPETDHLVNAAFFDKMKDGAIFVNTSRGEVVETAALKEAITRKGLKVGLDVFENEPAATANEFGDTGLSALINASHHIGASTDQASEAIADEVVRIIEEYRASGKPPNVVNTQAKSAGVTSLVVRHFNRVGVLAGVLDELRNASINVEEMENSIFTGGEAAVCTLRLDDVPDKELVKKLRALDNVIQVVLS